MVPRKWFVALPLFCSLTRSQEFSDAYVLVVDHKINSVRAIVPVLNLIHESGKPLLIISSDGLESEVLSTLVINRLNGLKVVAVKAPGFGDNRNAQLQDIAILTGADLVSQDLNMKLEDITLRQLGKAKSITVTANDTLILGGAGEKSDIENRCDQIRQRISESDSAYETEKLQERLAKLAGGVAQIKVCILVKLSN